MARRTTKFIFGCFDAQQLSDSALETITTIVEDAPRLLKLVPPDAVLQILSSPQAQHWLIRLADGDYASECTRFVELASSYSAGIAFDNPNFANNLEWQVLAPIFLELLRCPGDAVIEDPVCSKVLVFWAEVADGLEAWDDGELAYKFAQTYLQPALEGLKLKDRYPLDELNFATAKWDAGERHEFESFRMDFEDVLNASYVILGRSLIEDLCRDIIANFQFRQYRELEVNLAGLASFAIARGENSNLTWCIEQILRLPAWQSMCADNIPDLPDRVRIAAIALVAGMTGYWKQNEVAFPSHMAFVIQSLRHPSCASAAAKALQKLCLALRDILAPMFEDVFSTLWQFIRPEALMPVELKQKVFGAVAMVLQALPSEAMKFEPLLHLARSLEADSRSMFEFLRNDLVATTDTARNVMQAFAEIAIGLKPPESIDADTEDFDDVNKFWMQGEPQILHSNLFHHVYNAASAFRTDEEVIEACCKIVKAGHSERPRTAFSFNPDETTKFLSLTLHADTANVSTVLNTATSFFQLHASSPLVVVGPFTNVVRLISTHGNSILAQWDASEEPDVQEFSVAVLDFFTSILPNYSTILLSSHIPDNGLQNIITFASRSLTRGQDILPRRSAAAFWSTLFVTTTGPSFTLPGPVGPSRLADILRYVVEMVVPILYRLLAGECPRSEIERLTTPVRRLVAGHGMLAAKCLRAAASDARLMDLAVRERVGDAGVERFVNAVLAARGGKVTNELARKFWLDCRGEAFGYTT